MNIVLMHGVLGFARLGHVNYFNGVEAHLLAAFPGTKVLTTQVDFLGMVEDRATQAAAQIANATGHQLDAGKPLHLIAHSMGGLDARFLVSKNLQGLAPLVRTVICIGTPHLGSPIASLLNVANPFQLLPFAKHDDTFIGELRQKANAVHDLSTKTAANFNASCQDVPTVHYFDVAGVGRQALFQTSAPFLVPSAVCAAAAGRNDGVVPYISATRRRTPAAVWPADHADLVGHDLDRGPNGRPAFDYLSAYDALVRNCILLNQ
jgi:triacylglycerol lipase